MVATISLIFTRMNCQISGGGVRISEGESPGYMPRIITAPCCRLSFFVATAVEDMSIDMPNCELFVLPTLSCVYDDGSWFCVETT